MANLLVPQKPQPLSGSIRDEGGIVVWGGKFPRGFTFNVYWEAGTFLSPPSTPLANLFQSGLKSTQASIASGSGFIPVPANTNIYIEVTSVSPGGVESARSDMLFLSLTNASDLPVGMARDDSGQPKSMKVNEDGSILVAAGAPAPGASTAANQVTGNASLASIDSKLPAGGLATEAKQDTGNTSLASIDTDTSTIAGDTTSIDSKTPSLGQAAMAASVPVAIASDQSAVPITSTTLATEATLVTVDASLNSIEADATTIAGDTTSLDAKLPTQGQALMAASVPVAIASNQSNLPTSEAAFSTALQTIVAVSTVSILLPAVALASRRLIAIQNRGNNSVFVNTGTATTSSWEIAAGGSLRLGLASGVTVEGIRSTGSTNVVVWEFA